MTTLNRRSALFGALVLLPACKAPRAPEIDNSIYDVYHYSFHALVNTQMNFEVLGQGYGWSEGPTWDRKNAQLYFTDVPGNKAYKWRSGGKVEVFLDPSSDTSVTKGFREPGANGLLYRRNGEVLVCNHGKRAIESLDVQTGQRKILATHYKGKKFNSPNDVIESQAGDVYFTDPPYGLEGLDQSPLKELEKNGVYLRNQAGDVRRLIDDMSFPNGIALSPDERYLYISQSDPAAMHLYRLDLTAPSKPKTLFTDLSNYADDKSPGLPDGMAVDVNGNIFVTGPGGIFVIASNGDVLGRIKTGKASANCCFGEDGRTLFIANHDRLLRLQIWTLGLSWS